MHAVVCRVSSVRGGGSGQDREGSVPAVIVRHGYLRDKCEGGEEGDSKEGEA